MKATLIDKVQDKDLFCLLPDGRKICYRIYGNKKDEPLALIAGLGLQLIYWPPSLIEALVLRGYQVIVFDNRDVGLSSVINQKPPTRWQIFFQSTISNSYDLRDMAEDVKHLLESIHIEKIHLVGMSMGGMIAQTFAATYPDKVKSLVSIFSTTGSFKVGQPNQIIRLALLRSPSKNRKKWVAEYIRSAKYIGSTKFLMDEKLLKNYAELAWERSQDKSHDGVARQLGAIFKSGDRTLELRKIKVPTLVIHGDKDRLVATSGGYATATAIKNARLVLIAGLGHYITDEAVPILSDLIAGHASHSNKKIDILIT